MDDASEVALTIQRAARSRSLRAALIRRLGPDGEDILHEALVIAFCAQSSFRNEASPRTWLWTIIRSREIDARRRRARVNSALEDLRIRADTARGVAEPGIDVSNLLAELLRAMEEQRRCIQDEYQRQRLPDDARDLVLADWDKGTDAIRSGQEPEFEKQGNQRRFQRIVGELLPGLLAALTVLFLVLRGRHATARCASWLASRGVQQVGTLLAFCIVPVVAMWLLRQTPDRATRARGNPPVYDRAVVATRNTLAPGRPAATASNLQPFTVGATSTQSGVDAPGGPSNDFKDAFGQAVGMTLAPPFGAPTIGVLEDGRLQFGDASGPAGSYRFQGFCSWFRRGSEFLFDCELHRGSFVERALERLSPCSKNPTQERVGWSDGATGPARVSPTRKDKAGRRAECTSHRTAPGRSDPGTDLRSVLRSERPSTSTFCPAQEVVKGGSDDTPWMEQSGSRDIPATAAF